MAGRRLDFHEQVCVIEAYARGGLRAAVAAVPWRTRATVAQWLCRNGYHRKKDRDRAWTTGDREVLARLWRAGVPAAEIAKTLRRTSRGVCQYVYDNADVLGVQPRRRNPPLNPLEKRAIAVEMDAAVERLMRRTGRKRGSVVRHLISYLMTDGKRAKFDRASRTAGFAA